MKFTLSWLKDHLDTDASVSQIAETLTNIGLEVEQVIDSAAALAPFTVAYIEKAEQHPNADKLRVCNVQTSEGMKQIVCGAPNARAGIKVVLAKEGVTIPANGMVIKKTKIRNVESNGMLCSAEELSLDMPDEGIIELPESAPIGESIVKTLGLDDPVFDIAVTPNRSDALGVHGIARDLAAAGLGSLKPSPLEGEGWVGGPGGVARNESNSPTPPPAPSLKGRGNFPSPITVTSEDKTACPIFVGCTIKGVTNGPSPDWMQKRLRAIGLRPISALVDITNYITYDLSRPLHVYDAKKLKGNIRVTPAKKGEKLLALDNREYVLDESVIAIADDSGTLGIGGIIGGVSSSVDENTTDVFLECALFDPIRIAQTGRRLGINSDARYRFERGVDHAFVYVGAQIAIKMILAICGGSASEVTMVMQEATSPKTIGQFDPSGDVKILTGISISEEDAVTILHALGFECIPGDMSYDVQAPSFRPDIEGIADLVEEIARIKGYDKIPSTPLPVILSAAKDPQDNGSIARRRTHVIRRLWAARGLTEAVTWSFLAEKDAKLFGWSNPALSLLNPISADLDTMRPSLLPNLIGAARRNAARGLADLALFEAGNIFADVTPKGQELSACALRTGQAVPRNPFAPVRPADAFDAKADAYAALESAGANIASLKIDREAPNWYHPARSGRILLGKTVLGYFGELHPSALQKLDVDFPVAACEIFIGRLPAPRAKGKAKPPLAVSSFQAVQRDFAFLADARLQAAEITQLIGAIDKTLITDVSVFDLYAGKGIEPGRKSIAIAITLQAPDRTLTEEEINGISQKIIAAAQAKGLSLRQ